MGIVHKLLMKERYLRMDDGKMNRKLIKRNRILTMDGNIIENCQWAEEGVVGMEMEMENNGNETRCDAFMKLDSLKKTMKTMKTMKRNQMPEEQILKLYKYLAGRTRKHKSIDFINDASMENLEAEHHSLWALNGAERHPADNGIINKAMMDLNENVMEEEVCSSHHGSGRLVESNHQHQHRQQQQPQLPTPPPTPTLTPAPTPLPLTQQGPFEHQKLQQRQHQRQPQQPEQNKRDILLKIRQQIFERKRLRSKLYETATQVWRPW